MLKTFPMVEGRRLEIGRMPVLQGKIKVFLCHEAVPQENLETEKKYQEPERELTAKLLIDSW